LETENKLAKPSTEKAKLRLLGLWEGGVWDIETTHVEAGGKRHDRGPPL